MRLTAQEKVEIIALVKRSDLGVNRTLKQLGIHKRTFYNWYHAYSLHGINGLQPQRQSNRQWNSIPDKRRIWLLIWLEYTDHSPRMLAVKMIDCQGIFISESSVYRILKAKGLIQQCEHRFMSAGNEFEHKTKRVHQMSQTDFTYFKIMGWGWYYLSTVIDDYSRYIIHWELCSTMEAQDVKRTVKAAMDKTGLTKKRPPKLLSDNGPCYISKDLGAYLDKEYAIKQIHGKPLHPQTQGKIERYHRSMKNVVKLHHYYCPSELEKAIQEFVEFYNNQRYHESLKNLTPADVYYGRGEKILKLRQQIKEQTLKKRRKRYEKEKLTTTHSG